MLAVSEQHREARPRHRREARATAGFRVEVDERDETLGKRIRDSELEKIPVVVVFGERESEASLAVRTRGEGQSTQSLDELLAELGGARPRRRGALTSCRPRARCPATLAPAK